jgi:hypothetical protein
VGLLKKRTKKKNVSYKWYKKRRECEGGIVLNGGK